MKSKLSIFVTLFGWSIPISYLVYEYAEYGNDLSEHLFAYESFSMILLHMVMLFTPLGATITGYLIYERKKHYNIVLESEKRLDKLLNEWRSMIDAMPHGIMLVDKDLKILKANKYISELSGIPLNSLKHRKCHDIFHNVDTPLDGCPLARARVTGKTEILEYYNPELDKHFMASATPVYDVDGTVSAYAYPIFDITDIKKKEEEITYSKNAFLNMLKDIHASHVDLKKHYNDLIIAFSIAIDAKSPWTKGHSERVTSYAVDISREMGLTEEEIDTISTAGLLHDIGKIGTFDVILEKPDRLSDEEYALVKLHTVKGEQILHPIKAFINVLPIIRFHHEKMNGSGYPDGLMDEEIPLLARILCVADSYDSMVSDRPYRRSLGYDYAVLELKNCSGTHFDPRVVEAFMTVLEKEDVHAVRELL
jgi:putative nucleotidyltransferase with HDIG domain/PAS domain S-box-containing protein